MAFRWGLYTFSETKDDFVAFSGGWRRVRARTWPSRPPAAPAYRLKLAGEVQPIFRDYWESQVLPQIDGKQVDYIGEVDHRRKNQLLSRARALLFPIQWEEPFGLVMIEAMACGTPVLAMPGGAVAEIVRDGVNGRICADVEQLAARLKASLPASRTCRDFVTQHFSVDRMVDRYLDLYQQVTQLRAGHTAKWEPEWKT